MSAACSVLSLLSCCLELLVLAVLKEAVGLLCLLSFVSFFFFKPPQMIHQIFPIANLMSKLNFIIDKTYYLMC